MTTDPSPGPLHAVPLEGIGQLPALLEPAGRRAAREGAATYDKTQRRAHYREVDQILFDDAPCPIQYHRARARRGIVEGAGDGIKGSPAARPAADLARQVT